LDYTQVISRKTVAMNGEKIRRSPQEDIASLPELAPREGLSMRDETTDRRNPYGQTSDAPEQQPSPNGAVLQGQIKENDESRPKGASSQSTWQPSPKRAVQVSHEEVTTRPWSAKAKIRETPFSDDEGDMMSNAIGRQKGNEQRAVNVLVEAEVIVSPKAFSAPPARAW
jgi:hypothetical protein